jgi:secreted trypsin-like serine protease
MKRISWTLVFLSVLNLTLIDSASDILGGTPSKNNPVVVALTRDALDSSATCSAGLIAPRIVLTAAHCINGPAESYWVTAPGSDIESLDVTKIQGKEIYIAPDFERGKFPYPNDFAIIVLKSPFKNVKPVKIASLDEVKTWTNEESTVTHIGYGRYELVGANQSGGTVITSAIPLEIETNFSKQIPWQFQVLKEDSFSLTKISVEKTICAGDSGSPLIKKVGNEWVYIGVQSGGNGAGCIAPCESICVANQALAIANRETLQKVSRYLTESTIVKESGIKQISCIKGKIAKIIQGKSPKCPTGYKIKK